MDETKIMFDSLTKILLSKEYKEAEALFNKVKDMKYKVKQECIANNIRKLDNTDTLLVLKPIKTKKLDHSLLPEDIKETVEKCYKTTTIYYAYYYPNN